MATEPHIRFPFYARAALILLATFLVLYGLVIGQEVIVPLVFSGILAVLLSPTVTYLRSKRIHRVVAISLVVLLTIVIVLGLIFFIASQASKFSDTLPMLQARFDRLLAQLTSWLSARFRIDPLNIAAWINEIRATILSNKSAIIGETFATITGVIFTATLLPVYTWLILYYQPLLLEFIRQLFGKANQTAVGEVLFETRGIIQRYLIGLLIETIIVSAMTVAGMMLLGIDYAILLGIISGFLNLIPYIGTIIAAILPMIVALLTKDDPSYALWVLVVYLIIQFIDNNYVLPKIVASKVKINALVSVIVVIIGGALWGIPGMFLSIPVTAIFMVICHRIEALKPWGLLLGDTMPRKARYNLALVRRKLKK